MRVLLYKELLDNAQRIYSEYLDKRKETGRIQKLLNPQALSGLGLKIDL